MEKIIKLSSLSESLRKAVRPLIFEGKSKLGQFPMDIKKRVIKEMEGLSTEALEVKYVGFDDFGRKLYKSMDGKHTWVDVGGRLHTRTKRGGEPDTPLRSNLNIIVKDGPPVDGKLLRSGQESE